MMRLLPKSLELEFSPNSLYMRVNVLRWRQVYDK